MKNIGIWISNTDTKVVSVENGLDKIETIENEGDQSIEEQLTSHIYTAAGVVIIGPKGDHMDFTEKVKNDSKISFKLKGEETLEPMTDNQIIDWVKYFYKNH